MPVTSREFLISTTAQVCQKGVSNGPIQFKSACEIVAAARMLRVWTLVVFSFFSQCGQRDLYLLGRLRVHPPADSREATSIKMRYYPALRLLSFVLEVPVRLLGAKQRFPLIKEREIPASGKLTKSSLLAICIFSSACKTNLTTARARQNKRSSRMLAKTIRYPFFELGRVSWKRTHLEQRKNTNVLRIQ